MELGLKGKAALVTASSKGIGYGVAKVLASEGCRVVISSRNIDSISQAKDQIVRETGNREIYAFSADLTVKEDVDRLVRIAIEKLGSVDVLAYNTGPPRPGTFNELSDADWDNGVELLLMNAVWLAKRLLPGMERKKWGRLVFITSTTLRQPIPNLIWNFGRGRPSCRLPSKRQSELHQRCDDPDRRRHDQILALIVRLVSAWRKNLVRPPGFEFPGRPRTASRVVSVLLNAVMAG